MEVNKARRCVTSRRPARRLVEPGVDVFVVYSVDKSSRADIDVRLDLFPPSAFVVRRRN